MLVTCALNYKEFVRDLDALGEDYPDKTGYRSPVLCQVLTSHGDANCLLCFLRNTLGNLDSARICYDTGDKYITPKPSWVIVAGKPLNAQRVAVARALVYGFIEGQKSVSE